jgi:predicted RNase H-like HicB family nuclease
LHLTEDEVRPTKIITPEQRAEASQYSILIRWSPEDQIFIAEVPELNGAKTHGESAAEAADMVTEVAVLWLDMARELGWDIPAPRLYPES